MSPPSYDRLDMMLLESQGEVTELKARIAKLEAENEQMWKLIQEAEPVFKLIAKACEKIKKAKEPTGT